MADAPNQDIHQAGLAGWTIESRRSRYTIGYWIAFVLGMFGQFDQEWRPCSHCDQHQTRLQTLVEREEP